MVGAIAIISKWIFALLAISKAERAPPSPARMAGAEMRCFINFVKLLNFIIAEIDHVIEVTLNAGVGDRFGEDVNTRSVCLKGDQNIGRLNIVLVGNFLNDLILKEWRVVRSQRRVCSDNDTLGPAKFNKLFLGARRVKLDLIDSGNDFSVFEQTSKEFD